MGKERNVKCFIVNNDISIFQYEWFENMKVNQVELIGKSNKRYILGMFKTLKEAKDYIKNVLRVELKEGEE